MKSFRYILLALPLALTVLLAAACGGDDKGPVTPEAISVVFKLPVVESSKGQQFIVINATGSWELESSQEWLKVSAASGKGVSNSVVISYDENTGTENRTATLTLTSATLKATATLTQKGKGSTVDPGGVVTTSPGWMELPALVSGTGHKLVYHRFASAGKSTRSFSYDWSASDLVAHWVAYPLNNSLKGTGSRTDAWGFDPALSTSEQPTLYSAYKGGYDRGHQLPSADRLASQDNAMTFYFTNMTPQINSFNGQIWASAEGMVRNWSSSCDTLYVVTGCIVKGSTRKAYDNNGKAVTVPAAYYKAVLRYSKNTTLGHGGYMGLAMYFEHRTYTEKTVTKSMTDVVMSIDKLETKIGLDLFPNLERAIGKSLAEQVEAEDPTKISYWW